MIRSVVSGGTGFIGANLARRLVAAGDEVHLLVRSGYNPWRLANCRDAFVWHTVDLTDEGQLTMLIRQIRPDRIFHLAVHGAYPAQTDRRTIIATNLIGTANLVEACIAADCGVLVNAGSSSEYGLKDHAPSESEALEPTSTYAVTKATATLYCRAAAQRASIAIPTLRLYSAYGPYEEPSRLIPTVIREGLRGALPPLASPEIARDFVHVDDVVDAFLLAATRRELQPDAIYNVGTGVQTRLRAVVALAQQVMDIEATPAWGSMANRQWDMTVWVANNRLITERLGWRPRYDFATGFGRTVEWYRRGEAGV